MISIWYAVDKDNCPDVVVIHTCHDLRFLLKHLEGGGVGRELSYLRMGGYCAPHYIHNGYAIRAGFPSIRCSSTKRHSGWRESGERGRRRGEEKRERR